MIKCKTWLKPVNTAAINIKKYTRGGGAKLIRFVVFAFRGSDDFVIGLFVGFRGERVVDSRKPKPPSITI